MPNETALSEETEAIPLFITIADAARILKLSKRMMQKYIEHKKGPRLIRFGRAIRIQRDDFLRWANKDHPSLFHPEKRN